MKKIQQLGCYACLVLVGSTAVPGRVRAQEAAGAQPAQAETQPALEEIIVTAQRRAENVQKTALGVDVISSQTIENQGVHTASDLGNSVPAIQFSNAGNSSQTLYIRGVGTYTPSSVEDPAVAFNVDGVYIGRPSSFTGSLYDLSRVEVLKGPQGTLYGRNATGGAVNVLPNLPKLGDTSGDLSLAVGAYGEVNPEGYINLPVTDSSAARLSFNYLRHDGYQSDGTGDADSYAGRAQYLYRFDENLTLRISADYAHDGGTNPTAGTLLAIQNPFTGVITPSALGRNVGFADPRTTALFGQQYSFQSGSFLPGLSTDVSRTDNRFWGVAGELTADTDWGTLTVLPAHRESHLDYVDIGLGSPDLGLEHDKQTSVEVRFASQNTGLVRWLAGAYYYDEDIDAINQFNQIYIAPISSFDQRTESDAAFGRLTIAPVASFRIVGGVRYTHDDKTFDGTNDVLLEVCKTAAPIPACANAPAIPLTSSPAAEFAGLGLFPLIPGSLYGSSLPSAANSVFPYVTIPIQHSEAVSKITWHAGLEYDVAADSLLYANWDTGYHSGGFSFAEIKPTYAPETLSAYSIGSKNRFFDGRLQLNAEAFYWLYRNQQISHGGIDSTGIFTFWTDNAGSSTNKGIEISAKQLLGQNTQLNLDAQYLSAVYDKFTYQTPAGGTNAPPATGCPFAQTDPTHYTVNCAGFPALRSPRWSANFGVQQVVPLGRYELVGSVNTHYQTTSVVGFEMLSVERQGSYAQTDVAVELAPTGGRWSVTAFGNNLQDRRPYGSTYLNTTTNFIGGTVGPPRTGGVRADYKF
jgi:iron complex outermembrane recepter protein